MATPPPDDGSETAPASSGISVGGDASVGKIEVHGDVVGRDKVIVTEEQSYDVSDVPTNPYRGLASFTYTERAYYGGRSAQIADTVKLLTTPGEERSVLLVTGASGSGKSSFVQAGVIPALETFYQQHGDRRVRFAVMRPGRFPRAALAQALRDVGLNADIDAIQTTLTATPADQVTVLVLDQFEELFTQAEPADRDALCTLLCGLGAFAAIRTHCLLTLRSDYLGALFGNKDLYDLSKQNSIELRAMTPAELAEAIRTPLDEVNRQLGTRKRWEQSLVQKLTEDVGSDATLLPLLQVTLTALWDEPPRRLVLGRYRNLTTALQSTADRVYEQDAVGHDRSQADRETILAIFLDLVEVSMDDDPRRDVRRTMSRASLVRDRPERGPLIDELVDKRLLSSSAGASDEARIDIIHETLLTNWSVLKAAIAQQRDALQSRERFLDARREWLEHDRSDDYRLQGVYLAEARALVTAGDIATHDVDARAFIARSAALEGAERQRELDQARALAAEQQARADDSVRAAHRLRRWLVAVVVLAVMAVAAAGIAVYASYAANQQARINASRELAAESQSQRTVDPERAILLAREAEARVATRQADDALRAALVGSPIRRVLAGPGTALNGVALTPDGKTVAASSVDGGVRLWSLDSGSVLADVRAHQSPVAALTFSPDGQTLLTASADDPMLRFWDARSGAPTGQLQSGGRGIATAAYSPQGRYVAAGTADSKVRVWDTRSQQVVADLAGSAPLPIAALKFSPDEQRLAVAGLDGTSRVWSFVDAAQPPVSLKQHAGPVMSIAFDAVGARVLTAGFDGVARLSDAKTGAEQQVLAASSGPLSGAAFSPDGRTLATADLDGHAWLWAANDGHRLAELRGHSQRISSLSFSPSGSEILTTSDDATARIWSVTTGDEVLELRGHALSIPAGQYSVDGRMVVTASFDKSVRVWNVDETPAWTTLSGHTAPVLGVALSPDGNQVATASQDNSVRTWQPGRSDSVARRDLSSAASSVAYRADGARLAFGLFDGLAHLVGIDLTSGDQPLSGHTDWIYSVAFSPDGRRVLTASRDRTAKIWDADSGAQVGELRGHASDVTSAAWDPRGRFIATSSIDKTARLWNAATLQLVRELQGHTDIVRRVVFSPDGRQLVTASYDNTARVWDPESGKELAQLKGHTDHVIGAAFSPDGALLATGGADETIVIWDTATWQPITTLRGPGGDVNDLAFSTDGKHLAAAGGQGVVRIYPRELFAPRSEVLDLIAVRVTRQPAELTADERAQFIH